MTRPIDARDSLRKAVEAQRVQREAIQKEADRIQGERDEATARATESETPQ